MQATTRIQEYPITARGRGNASWGFPKKPWRIKYADGKSHRMLKGSPQESPAKAKKWTLINNYGDKTLMRNILAFEVSKRLNSLYTPWCQPVDVIMNGEYKGCYQLCDQITIDKARVPITEMTPTDNEEPEVSGGYLVEVDAYASQETSWFTSSRGNPVTIKHPGDDDITTQQYNYVRGYFNLMESALFSANYSDPESGFRKYLDVESFLKHFIVGEFSGNMDTYWSVYMYKDREENQFHVSPCWDFDLAFDNDSRIYPVNGRSDWAFRGGSCAGNMRNFVNRILSDEGAEQQLHQLWISNRKEGFLDEKTLIHFVDSMAEAMEASARLNFIRWPILGSKVHQNVSALGSFEAEVGVLRDYIPARLSWIDNYIGYDPGAMYTDSTYYIHTPDELIEFAKAVSGGAAYSAGYLEADLDMEKAGEEFLTIGTQARPFRGTFDGQGHRIRNLHVSTGDYAGLFGAVGGGANISNLVLDSSCSIRGANYVGLVGGSTGTGKVTLSCLGNEAEVTATGVNAAGIIGCNKGSNCTFAITDCYNAANVKGNSESAAICGWLGTNATLRNCYNIGSVEGYNYRNDFYRGSADAVNCYSTTTTQVNRISAADVESGKLCYRLNNGVTLDPIWYQTIGQDGHPVFDATHLVVLKGDDDTYYNVSNLAGDVNDDGILDETDALWIMSFLTGETPEGFVEGNADANLDGQINVGDVVTVRRILSETPLGTQSLTATLYSSNATVKAGGTRKVTVWFNTSRSATALQADIVLSEGLSIQEGSIAWNSKIKTSSHQDICLSLSEDAEGAAAGYRLILYAPDNKNFAALTGTALTFTLVGAEDFQEGTYEIRNQYFITADGVAHEPADAAYSVALAKTYVSTIELQPSSIEMIAGTDTTLTAIILPATTTQKTLGWTSSDEAVATVTDGIVTAIASGQATITAKATDGSGKKGTALITVYDDATPIEEPREDSDDSDSPVYDLSGRRVAGSQSANRKLPRGIYIIDGKKRVVNHK